MRYLSQFFHWLLANQFLSGGVALMSFGGVVAWFVTQCRQIPGRMYKWCERRFIVTIDVANDDPLFSWISVWLAEQPYSKRTRALTATSEHLDHSPAPTPNHQPSAIPVPRILLTPAPGIHLLLYKRRLIWLERSRKDAPTASGGSSDFGSGLMSRWRQEVYNIKLLGRSQSVARKLLEDAQRLAFERRHREKRTEIFVVGWSSWQSIGERTPRGLETVFLPEGFIDGVVADISEFLGGQQWYIDRGIPWRRGFLLYGSPGSGKTSLISALTGHFKTNLYILSISSAKIADDEISRLLAEVPPRSFVLLEDIDAAFEQRKKSKDVQNRLSFSGLLNALDGVASKDGTVVFMTTNHRERLDEALIRPGRADVHVEFTLANAYQAESMYRAFFPETDGVDDFGGKVERARMTMAEVQAHLLLHRDSAIKALNVGEAKERAA